MPVQTWARPTVSPSGEWTTANQEVPEGIYLQLHVTAPQMMVLAKVATTSEQMQDKVATVTKFIGDLGLLRLETLPFLFYLHVY